MKVPAEFTLATARQSQKVDEETIKSFGIDSFTLMEVAGSSAAKKLLNEVVPGSHGIFLCGKGNNCGDALVVARYLSQHNIETTIVFVAGADDFSPDAQKNYELLQSIDQNDRDVDITFYTGWDDFDQSTNPDFIVDGMLGTGLNSDLRGDFVDAVQWANTCSCPVFAMDIPTGLHGDTGQIMGDAIKATQTFAFGTLKQGFYLGKGSEQCGKITYCALPFPDFIKQKYGSTYLIDESWVPEHKSEPARHKYEAGVVHIIAGSEGLTGAAIMAAKSAWAEGAGAVILICPRGILPVFENNMPQIIKKPVGDHDDVYFNKKHLDEVIDIAGEKDGPILLGPGLGRKGTTSDFATAFLSTIEQDIIIDADALWALAQRDQWKKPGSASWILTPHPGELSTLLNKKMASDDQRLELVRQTAQQQQVTILSKGFPVMVGTPGGKIYLTGYDTRIFSRAGFGDILAGKITAFKALHGNDTESCIRALLNGKAKAASCKEKYNYSTLEPFDLV